MQIEVSPSALQKQTTVWHRQNLTIGFVPTMGYLHQGHRSLIEAARKKADKVVVSVFVNPTQFGPNEDLDSYPRNQALDESLTREAGVDLLFRPDPAAMYTPDAATWVEVPSLAQQLCALSRPIHFRGVCTIVAKLFHLVQPTFAFFGEKDWQQLAILRRMVADLMFPIELIGCPIVREPDGLALSSRNVNLTPDERAQAIHINKGLSLAAPMIEQGVRDVSVLLAAVQTYLEQHISLGQIDYLEAVDPDKITPVTLMQERALLAIAIKFSKVRLIDNRLVEIR